MNAFNPTAVLVLVVGLITFAASYFLISSDRPASVHAPVEIVNEKPAKEFPEMEPKGAENKPDADAPAAPAAQVNGGEYAMPANGGVWPWPVGFQPLAPVTLPVSLTHVVNREHAVHGAAVNPASGKAIVILWETNFKAKTTGTHILWADLNTGSVTHRWRIDKLLFATFDLHSDGRRFLMRNNGGIEHNRHVLELCTITDDGQLQRKPWQPFTAAALTSAGHSSNHVRWAGFVGREHVAAVCANGALSVWKLDGLKLAGTMANVSGYPALTPDGQRLAFATGNHVALLDPATGQVVGERNLGSLPKDPVLAFHPDGRMLACAGTGRVAVLDLRQNQVWNAMIADLKFKQNSWQPDFGWAGEGHFYYDGNLFDVQMPIPIWHYVGPKWASPRGREFWAVTQPYGDKEMALRSFRLPHPAVQTRLSEVMQQPGLFALRPGDSVRIDVSGLPAARRQEVNAVLQRRVQQVGYRLSNTAPIVLQASVDEMPTPRTITYHFGNKSIRCPYEEQCARLKFVNGNKVLWEATGSDQPPFMISLRQGTDVAAHVRSQYGSPDYKVFSERPLPGVIRGDQSKHVFGTSDLGVSGVRERRF